MAEKFRPEDHFRNLKGQMYLEVRWRLVWLRSEHPDAVIETELVHADWADGLAVFKARVSFMGPDGREVYAIAHGSETRRDFGDFAEKAETKSVGRAVALLGYGTQFAQELEEGDRVVDSPVDRQDGRRSTRARTDMGATNGRPGLAVVREEVDLETLRGQVEDGLAADRDAAARIPKAAGEMNEAELTKTLAWLNRRARALAGNVGSRPAPSPPRQPAYDRAGREAEARRLLAADAEGAAVLPKPLPEQTDEELEKTITWLKGRDAAIKKGQIAWLDPNQPLGQPARSAQASPQAQAQAYAGLRRAELNGYVDAVTAWEEEWRERRAPGEKAAGVPRWRALYGQGQGLTGMEAPPVGKVADGDMAAWVARFKASAAAELAQMATGEAVQA